MEEQTRNSRSRDTGMALVLVCLIVQLLQPHNGILVLAICLLVLTMTWPAAFAPAARVWFGLSHLLGTVVSTVILSLVFWLVVTPVAIFRKMLGADALQMQKWREGSLSVLKGKEHIYTKEDLERPY